MPLGRMALERLRLGFEERTEGPLRDLWRRIRDTVTDYAMAACGAIKATVAARWWHRNHRIFRPKAPLLASA